MACRRRCSPSARAIRWRWWRASWRSRPHAGLLESDPTNIRPTALGRRFLNDLQSLFLADARERRGAAAARASRSGARWSLTWTGRAFPRCACTRRSAQCAPTTSRRTRSRDAHLARIAATDAAVASLGASRSVARARARRALRRGGTRPPRPAARHRRRREGHHRDRRHAHRDGLADLRRASSAVRRRMRRAPVARRRLRASARR